MFNSDKKQEPKPIEIGINTRIKNSFVTEEEIKAFLKNGGKIDYLEMGETRAFVDNGFTKKSDIKSNSTKTLPPKKERITESILTESILVGDDQPQSRKKVEVKTEIAESVLNEDSQPQVIDLAQEITLNIYGMHSEVLAADSNKIDTNPEQNTLPIEFKANTATDATFQEQPKPFSPPSLLSLIKAKKKRKNPNRENQLSKEEYARRAHNAKKRAAAVAENKDEHMGICLTHGEVAFKIYITGKKRHYRSRCNVCRSTRYTENGKFTPCSENMKRIQEIRVKRREAIKQGQKTFIATCKYHGLTTYVIAHKNSRCKICKDSSSRIKKTA